ncbi:response regulator transcription factor [Variovorax sp. CY25R-8]|uniref:response regulator n=1 Tax=Variovorax sp. CY25R-8 TaxID=2855501 RepID=UPI0021BA73F9|nr:response regulator transcription factor [Variovorax sp. CY25R-8]MCT8173420.1 response regulator transcription factor [Variovorax sp. CY25R-8]
MIDLLIVDDHAIFRSGLQRLMLDESDIRVAGQASNVGQALEQLQQGRFSLVLLDINLEGRSGLDLLASIRIKWPRLPVLVLSMYPETQYALVAIREGANGYVAKDAEPAELMGAIRQVAAGGQYVGHRIASQLHEQAVGLDTRPPHHRLTMREHQIMLMLLKGMSLTHIGEEMLISVKTVSTHRANLLEKLGVASTAELVLYAVRNGLIH